MGGGVGVDEAMVVNERAGEVAGRSLMLLARVEITGGEGEGCWALRIESKVDGVACFGQLAL